MRRINLERHLRKYGCQFKREGGRHSIWEHPAKDTWTSIRAIAKSKIT